jgi:hypothetical protein
MPASLVAAIEKSCSSMKRPGLTGRAVPCKPLAESGLKPRLSVCTSESTSTAILGDEYEDEVPSNLLSDVPNPWTNRFIAPYSYQEALEEDGAAESLPNI